MTMAVALFGLFVAALGIAGILSPERLLALVTRVQSRLGLSFISGIRLLAGVALFFAAPASRAPLYLQLVGGLALVAGIATPFVGTRRFESVMAWWRARAPWAVRSWSAFVLSFGLSLVWAVFPLERGA